MYKVIHIFEHFLHDNNYMTQLDNSITHETNKVPGLVLLIANIIQEGSKTYGRVKNQSELQQLFGLFFNYINDKLTNARGIKKYNTSEFKPLFDECVQLVVIKFKFAKKFSPFKGLICSRT